MHTKTSQSDPLLNLDSIADDPSDINSGPPVSVIIPCFNHGQYLLDAIASVERCDPNLYEIIVVNDGSNDLLTLEVIGRLERDGYHVINQENQGLAASRNNGIQASRGRYILPLDADNRIYPEYITVGIKVLNEKPEVGVVYGRPELYGEISARNYPELESFNLPRLVIENYIDACALIRKSAIVQCGFYDAGFPFPGLEDWDLWLTMVQAGWQFHFEDALLFQYQVLANSMIAAARQADKITRNYQYLYGKHAMLIKRVMFEQLHEKTHQPRSIQVAQLWHKEGMNAVVQKALSKVKRKLTAKSSS